VKVAVGDEAPPFTLLDQDGQPWALGDQRGTPVVLYFYPRDDTPGCTTQACGIRDAWSDFARVGAVVAGISPDDQRSHARFAARHGLPHTLLADPERVVIERYAVWGAVRLGDKMKDSVVRSTFLVGADGTLIAEWRGIDPAVHADEVIARLQDLAA
jgi:thioredoxin-dependent peroxiredoxin